MRLGGCKDVIADTIAALVAEGVRKADIEIELIHYIKRVLYKED
jgi:hypothetical protein